MEEVSNHTLMMVLNSAKKFNQLEANVKKGLWGDFAIAKPVHAIRNQTLGLLGCGRIARCLAVKAQAFGMKVIAYDPYIRQETVKPYGVTLVSKDELLECSDFISMHLLLNEDTRKSINADFFKKMKKSAIFINTGRGAQVVESELSAALKECPDRTALLDVTWPEPPEEGSEFYTLPNVFLTPHIAGSQNNEWARMALYIVEEFERTEDHLPVRYEVTEKMLETMA